MNVLTMNDACNHTYFCHVSFVVYIILCSVCFTHNLTSFVLIFILFVVDISILSYPYSFPSFTVARSIVTSGTEPKIKYYTEIRGKQGQSEGELRETLKVRVVNPRLVVTS